ncbi:MAG: hypothetical protein ACKO9A_10070, partial [Alphaproteobacteria bacterium]
MAKHRFHPTRYFNAIGVAEPCLRVADGDTVVTDTLDASGLEIKCFQDIFFFYYQHRDRKIVHNVIVSNQS